MPNAQDQVPDATTPEEDVSLCVTAFVMAGSVLADGHAVAPYVKQWATQALPLMKVYKVLVREASGPQPDAGPPITAATDAAEHLKAFVDVGSAMMTYTSVLPEWLEKAMRALPLVAQVVQHLEGEGPQPGAE